MVRQNVISIDLWNTLIRISDKNAKFITQVMADSSNFSEEKIRKIVSVTGRYYDEISIVSGLEVSAITKLDTLIKNCRSHLSCEALENLIDRDLMATPPCIIEESSLLSLDNYLIETGVGMVISSNSGFVSSRIMRKVVDGLLAPKLKSLKRLFFSEEVGFAKPSAEFFQFIETEGYKILCHIGDHPVADRELPEQYASLLYDPKNQMLGGMGVVASIAEIPAKLYLS